MLLLIILVAIFLTVYWFWLFRREKLFAFEDKIADGLAWICAKLIIFKRQKFNHRKRVKK